MCAIEAGKRGRSVAVLERNETVGKKIRISGGGRCNFTNIYTTPEHFISGNPNFHKSALARYTPEDFIRSVRRHRIAYHEKKHGQLFCDGSSLDALVTTRHTSFRENILFTHRGLSGPAILQISSYWKPADAIALDVVPEGDLKNLPRRFIQKWRQLYGCGSGTLEKLREWTLVPSGSEGYSKAEVTLGGVDTNELSSKTMETRQVPGLYFIG